MKARDMVGNFLNEGDLVSFALPQALAVGHVTQVSALVSANPNEPQRILVNFTLPMQVLSNGIVPGVVKAVAEEQKVVSE